MREGFLVDVARPGAGLDFEHLSDAQSRLYRRTSCIHDDDFIGPGGAVDRVGDVAGLVEGDDGDQTLPHQNLMAEARRLRRAGISDRPGHAVPG